MRPTAAKIATSDIASHLVEKVEEAGDADGGQDVLALGERVLDVREGLARGELGLNAGGALLQRVKGLRRAGGREQQQTHLLLVHKGNVRVQIARVVKVGQAQRRPRLGAAQPAARRPHKVEDQMQVRREQRVRLGPHHVDQPPPRNQQRVEELRHLQSRQGEEEKDKKKKKSEN